MKVPESFLAAGRLVTVQGFTAGANGNIGAAAVEFCHTAVPFDCRIIDAWAVFEKLNADSTVSLQVYDDAEAAVLNATGVSATTDATPFAKNIPIDKTGRVHGRGKVFSLRITGQDAGDDFEGGAEMTLLLQPVRGG